MKLFETMVRIRTFELVALELFELGLTPGRMHPYIGQEAVAAGACAAIEEADQIISTHRSGGHLVAKGADMRLLFAEFMGKGSGYGNGKGGPMHFHIPELGVLCTTGIVGNGIPVAAGAALACQYLGTKQVILCFLGDGAANTGACHEGMNMSAIWKLPVVFVCENNQYAETMPVGKAFAVPNIAVRAAGYGMSGVTVDGNDVESVFAAVRKAAVAARKGLGPSFIEAQTYRIEQHFSGESDHYRKQEEKLKWLERDPIDIYRNRLLGEGDVDEGDLEQIVAAARREAQGAAEQAKKDPDPPAELLLRDVYASPGGN
jgi:pyruvate dehydrogenase E1 component alpha subunit